MASKSLNRPNSWQKQVNPNTRKMQALMKDVRGNVVRLTRNSKDLDEWNEKLAPYTASNCFVTGAHADQVREIVNQISGVVDQTSLPSGANAEIVKGTMAEACMTMVTNVGEDIKTELQKIAVESYNARNSPQQTAELIGQKIDSLSKSRCQAIARTETCRAANIANYLNAKEMGAKSYSVICNEGCCEYCQDEYGTDESGGVGDTVYDIEDTDNLPPLHPNCRCTPVWSMDPVEDSEGETTEDVESIFEGEYTTYTTEDRFNGSEITVREYENGVKIAINNEVKITHDDIVAHVNSLPEPLRTIGPLNEIEVRNHVSNVKGMNQSGTVGGKPHTKIVINGGNFKNKPKSEILDTLNHELAHALSHSKSKNNDYQVLSDKKIYQPIHEADNTVVTYINVETGKQETIDRWPSGYGKQYYEDNKSFDEDFTESTRLYLNPTTHDKFVKEFPNRANYLESIYGQPNFDKMYITELIKKERK